MNNLSEFDPKRLRSVRKTAILKGFGYIQYRFLSAKFQAGASRLTSPRYAWFFVPQADPKYPGAIVYTLPMTMNLALQEVLSNQRPVYVEGWGLLTYTRGSIELTPDSGPLSQDHPHAGWPEIKLTATSRNIQGVKGRVRFAPQTFYHKSLQLVGAFTFLILLLGMRFGLMVDGTDDAVASKWSLAGLPSALPVIKSSYTPSILSPALRAGLNSDQGIGISPLERGEDANAEKQLPMNLVVLGLYSNEDLAIQNSLRYKQYGYETMVFARRVFGGRELFAIGIPYRGFEPLVYLKEIQNKLLPYAWLLDNVAISSAVATP